VPYASLLDSSVSAALADVPAWSRAPVLGDPDWPEDTAHGAEPGKQVETYDVPPLAANAAAAAHSSGAGAGGGKQRRKGGQAARDEFVRAASLGDVESMCALRRAAGVNCKSQRHDWTALMVAAANGQCARVQACVARR
jgi:hypothetical protein